VVEQREETAFRQALAARHAKPRLVATISGLDYSDGKKKTLRIYQSAASAAATAR